MRARSNSTQCPAASIQWPESPIFRAVRRKFPYIFVAQTKPAIHNRDIIYRPRNNLSALAHTYHISDALLNTNIKISTSKTSVDLLFTRQGLLDSKSEDIRIQHPLVIMDNNTPVKKESSPDVVSFHSYEI
jgi:hypothetical protein